MEERSYKCANCGGVLEFDVEAQALKCENCGTVIEIINDQSKIVEHPLNKYSSRTIRQEEKTSRTMECKSCGARIEVEADCTATECPYCGTTYVLADKQEEVVVPDGVVPFQIDRKQVGGLFRNWLKKRWLAPGALRTLYQRDKLQGVYLPYWTFDADTACYYTAQGGRTHTETYRDREGVTRTRSRTDWFFTSGTVGHFFDDVLVRASRKLDDPLLERIEPFHTQAAASYSPDYFSGYEAECCSRSLEDAHQEARQEIERELYQLAEQDVLRHFDAVRDVHIRPEYRRETYKHLILPVYATAYNYRGKQYTVLVNGQTGAIKGGYPKSVMKIALLAAAGVALFVLAYQLMWGWDEAQAEPRGGRPPAGAEESRRPAAEDVLEKGGLEQWTPVTSGDMQEWTARRIG